jgi:hypothetical protein
VFVLALKSKLHNHIPGIKNEIDLKDSIWELLSPIVPIPSNAKHNGQVKSSQVNTLPKAKSKTRSKQNKGMDKFSSVYS